MDRRLDPRSIVTPYAFAVHPDLVGRPLATPWQRLGAILVDLLVIFLFSHLVPGALLALGSALLLVWLAIRKPGREVFGKLFRVFVGCLGASVLFVTVLVVVLVRFGPDAEELAREAIEEFASNPDREGQPGLREVVGIARGAFSFQGVESREEAQEIANGLAASLLELDLTREEIRGRLADLIPEDASWAPDGAAIVEEAMATLPAAESGPVEETSTPETGAPVSALPSDSPPEEPATPVISDPLAQDSIQGLNDLLQEEREARRRAERRARELEEDAPGGFLDWLYGIIDDLGLGFGWGALYLTVTHAWWRGSSVGKRLFRIRVVMIDQRPLNWWLSFERAGGYAAGFATGLLGFAQVFWDPNRQAIHDKVSETIVIQDGKPPIPGPWLDEGKAVWAARGVGEENVR